MVGSSIAVSVFVELFRWMCFYSNQILYINCSSTWDFVDWNWWMFLNWWNFVFANEQAHAKKKSKPDCLHASLSFIALSSLCVFQMLNWLFTIVTVTAVLFRSFCGLGLLYMTTQEALTPKSICRGPPHQGWLTLGLSSCGMMPCFSKCVTVKLWMQLLFFFCQSRCVCSPQEVRVYQIGSLHAKEGGKWSQTFSSHFN